MPRRRIPKTEIEEIQQTLTGVLKWAQHQGFINIAAELRSAIDLLPRAVPLAAVEQMDGEPVESKT
jgi:hypothetical protein